MPLLYLEEEDESDGHGSEPADVAGGTLTTNTPESIMQTPRPFAAAAAVASGPARAHGVVPALNKINMNVQGGQVHLEAMLDRKGIAALKRKLVSLAALLEDESDEDKSDEGEPGTDE